MAPTIKASGTTHPCAHVHVNEEAGNVSGCVAESSCCRKLPAQPCQPSNLRHPWRWSMKPNLRHADNQSGCLVRSNRLRLEFVLIAGWASQPTHHSWIHCAGPSYRAVLLRLPWLRHTRSGPDYSGKARKILLLKTRTVTGYLLIPRPRPEPERLSDYKAAKGGSHEQTKVIMSNF